MEGRRGYWEPSEQAAAPSRQGPVTSVASDCPPSPARLPTSPQAQEQPTASGLCGAGQRGQPREQNGLSLAGFLAHTSPWVKVRNLEFGLRSDPGADFSPVAEELPYPPPPPPTPSLRKGILLHTEGHGILL